MSDFKAICKTVSHTQQLNATREKIFPLLCPTREYDWIEDWDCTLIHSDSGFAEPNCVFSTQGTTTKFDKEFNEIWVVSCYEPPARIEFVKFAAKLYVVKYEVARFV